MSKPIYRIRRGLFGRCTLQEYKETQLYRKCGTGYQPSQVRCKWKDVDYEGVRFGFVLPLSTQEVADLPKDKKGRKCTPS